MNIEKTKEQIAAMPELWVDGDCHCGTFRLTMPHGMSRVSEGERGVLFIHTKVWCPDDPVHKLVALSDSHTELLDLAKRVQEHLRFGLDEDALAMVVDEAIKKAEA